MSFRTDFLHRTPIVIKFSTHHALHSNCLRPEKHWLALFKHSGTAASWFKNQLPSKNYYIYQINKIHAHSMQTMHQTFCQEHQILACKSLSTFTNPNLSICTQSTLDLNPPNNNALNCFKYRNVQYEKGHIPCWKTCLFSTMY